MKLAPELLSNQMPRIVEQIECLSKAERVEVAEEMLQVIGNPERLIVARISAGNVLGLLGDPRIDALRPLMCRVPRGPFWMGTDESEASSLSQRFGIPEAWFRKSTPRHQVELDAYEIAMFPVTEGEYARFVRETEVDEVPDEWRGRTPPPYRSNHPVNGVSWQGVLLYVAWISEATGLQYRIPTEAEWEKAARGTDGGTFPWGERFDPSRCNTREGGVGDTTPVGIYGSGASPCGALDMAGNVEEFTADLYWPYPGSRFEDPDYGTYRMTRGGVFSLDSDLGRCDRRHGDCLAGPTGFRLARSAADEWSGRSEEGTPVRASRGGD